MMLFNEKLWVFNGEAVNTFHQYLIDSEPREGFKTDEVLRTDKGLERLALTNIILFKEHISPVIVFSHYESRDLIKLDRRRF